MVLDLASQDLAAHINILCCMMPIYTNVRTYIHQITYIYAYMYIYTYIHSGELVPNQSVRVMFFISDLY